ncbi:MAG: hypothetical protein ACRCXC_05115 [Legionella sp.]
MTLFFQSKALILFGFIVLAGCSVFYPHDWTGWMLLGGSFYCIAKMNFEPKVKRALLFILFVHQVFVLYYFFSYDSYVEGIDFTAFHYTAKTIAETNFFSFGTDSALFSNLFALFYKINPSQLFGQEIAALTFMASCIVLLRIIKYYQFDQYAIPILFLYALAPAALLWTSIILREPFEMLFLMLAFEFLIYSKSACIRTSRKLIYLGCALLLTFLTCVLHKILLLCIPGLFFIFLILPAKDSIKKGTLIRHTKTVQYTLLILLPFLLLYLVTHQVKPHVTMPPAKQSAIIYTANNSFIQTLLNKLSSGDVYKTLTNYRYGDPAVLKPAELSKLFNATTNYDKGDLAPTNLFQFIYMSLRQYANYSFLPALLVTGKWSLTNLIFSLIYLIRFILFCSALTFCITLYKRKLRSPLVLLAAYLLISYVSSLGTISYGTALRHQLITDWIVVLIGTPLIYNFLTETIRNKVRRPYQRST